MRQMVEKIWFFAAFLCLLGTLSAFVAAAGNHKVSEENSSELIELEEFEAIHDRRINRQGRRRATRRFESAQWFASQHFDCIPMQSTAFTASTERDRLNGLGTYLLT